MGVLVPRGARAGGVPPGRRGWGRQGRRRPEPYRASGLAASVTAPSHRRERDRGEGGPGRVEDPEGGLMRGWAGAGRRGGGELAERAAVRSAPAGRIRPRPGRAGRPRRKPTSRSLAAARTGRGSKGACAARSARGRRPGRPGRPGTPPLGPGGPGSQKPKDTRTRGANESLQLFFCRIVMHAGGGPGGSREADGARGARGAVEILRRLPAETRRASSLTPFLPPSPSSLTEERWESYGPAPSGAIKPLRGCPPGRGETARRISGPPPPPPPRPGRARLRPRTRVPPPIRPGKPANAGAWACRLATAESAPTTLGRGPQWPTPRWLRPGSRPGRPKRADPPTP